LTKQVKQESKFAIFEGCFLSSNMDIGLFLISDLLQKKAPKAGIRQTRMGFPVF